MTRIIAPNITISGGGVDVGYCHDQLGAAATALSTAADEVRCMTKRLERIRAKALLLQAAAWVTDNPDQHHVAQAIHQLEMLVGGIVSRGAADRTADDMTRTACQIRSAVAGFEILDAMGASAIECGVGGDLALFEAQAGRFLGNDGAQRAEGVIMEPIGAIHPWESAVEVLGEHGDGAVPTSMAEAIALTGQLSDPAAGECDIVVLRSVQTDGRATYTVVIPGTQSWGVGGSDPNDASTNLELFLHSQSEYTATIQRALETVASRDPRWVSNPEHRPNVTLVGFSQGGLAAASLAATAGFRRRFEPTHVVAAGSPIARAPVPASTKVIALQHKDDVVPRVDGKSNPADPNWLTINRQVRPSTVAQPVRSPIADHTAAQYSRTMEAAVRSGDPHVAEALRGTALAGATSTTRHTFRLRRQAHPSAPRPR